MSGIFLPDSRFAEVLRRAKTGAQPWAAAQAHLLGSAEAALGQAPLSVRQNGGSPFFRQDAAYVTGRDGVIDKAANHESGNMAALLSRTALDLALAWRLTGEARYAEKALTLIHTWCINQNTRMIPTGLVWDAQTPGGQYGGDIIIFDRLCDLMLACYLLRDCPLWDLQSRAAVKRWVRDMLAPQRDAMFYEGCEMYNNWEDARLVYLAKGAIFLDDLDLLIYVFDRWRHILPLKMTEAGELPRETMRTRSLLYTLFALGSAMQIAEMARQLGVDLYDCSVNGRSIRKALDYAAPYLLHLDQWPHQMIKPFAEDPGHQRHLGIFEMAHARWGDPRYLEVLAAHGGRPVTAGHATLLYGE